MSGKPAVIAVLAVMLCILGASAAAQDEANQLAGIIGRTFISDQGIPGAIAPNNLIRSGKGLTFEVNYSHRFFGTAIYSVSGEVPAVFNLDEDLDSGNFVPKDYKQIFVTPAVRVNLFPSTAVSPWVSLGGGFGHFSQNKNLLFYGANPGSSSTTGVLEGGFGLDVNPFQRHRLRRFGFRLDVRDFWSGTPDFPLAPTGKSRQHNYFVGGGVIWHF
jgi:hypothetical protein